MADRENSFSRTAAAASAAFIAAFPVFSFNLQAQQRVAKPNIIFILLDDYGYADCGCNGSTFYETPNIDRLAKNGIRFTEAYAACPVSSPTRAAIMTGKYPVKTGITDWIPGRQATNTGSPSDKLIALPFRQQLELEEVTIAEKLRENGYITMISGKWHLGSQETFWPENQGFNINKGGYSAGAPVRNNKSNGYFSPYGNPRLEDGPAGEYLTDRQTDEALRFITENKGKPFFLYLPYYAVHNPMQGKEALVARFKAKADSMGLSGMQQFTREKDWIKKGMSENFKERIIQSNPVYAAMIYSVDENIGRIVSYLEKNNLSENTMIIITSDNGGLATSEGSPTCNAPLRAGKGWLYEGGIRVPLVIYYAGNKHQGKVIDSPVSSIDFFPTLCELSKTNYDKSKIDGVSILPLLKGKKLPERPLFWHYPHYSNQGTQPGSAVRLGNYKLIDNFETGKVELYRIDKDISESEDLSDINPEKTQELFRLLEQWRKATSAQPMKPNPKWSGI